MLQRRQADPGLQLRPYDEILFPLLMLPAPSWQLVLALHPPLLSGVGSSATALIQSPFTAVREH